METEAAAGQNTAPRWTRFVAGRNPAWTLFRIAIVVVATILLFTFVLVPIRVTGNSMLPNYRSGQIKFVNKLAYMNSEPQRGDVVAVNFLGRQVLLLKRIIALPGETVELRDGLVYINGELLDEPYAVGRIPDPETKTPYDMGPVVIEPGIYIVMGDNRPVSEGFRKHRREIIGKVL